jgi:hypothetical protein
LLLGGETVFGLITRLVRRDALMRLTEACRMMERLSLLVTNAQRSVQLLEMHIKRVYFKGG